MNFKNRGCRLQWKGGGIAAARIGINSRLHVEKKNSCVQAFINLHTSDEQIYKLGKFVCSRRLSYYNSHKYQNQLK